jgi:hypothetical protein
VEEERIAQERIETKPVEIPQPFPFVNLRYEDHKEYFDREAEICIWHNNNCDMAEALPELQRIQQEYKEVCGRAYKAFDAIPNREFFSIPGGFCCPACEGDPLPMPSNNIDCSDNHHQCVCSKNPNHIIEWLP